MCAVNSTIALPDYSRKNVSSTTTTHNPPNKMATNLRSIKDNQLPIFTRYYAHLAERTRVK